MRRRWIGLSALLIAFLMSPREAHASCVGLTLGEQVEFAHVIFSGRLEEIGADGLVKELSKELSARFSQNGHMLQLVSGNATFNVDRIFKGRAHETQHVAHPYQGSIGVDFKEGLRYLVFARPPARRISLYRRVQRNPARTS